MSDPFDTFSIPARPWIDLSDLQSRFHALAAQHHPDTLEASKTGGAATASSSDTAVLKEADFSEINEAHQLLKDPVTRLQLLLAREAPAELEALKHGEISMDMSEHFLHVATILREVSAFQHQYSSARSPLARAVLRAEHLSLRHDLDRALAKMDELWHQCESLIKGADSVWERRNPSILRQLATVQREMTFLQKWRTQLREARLTMSL
ncbi:MAG: hypothetical protein WCO60_02235 [Verrucomicrobiota bacterium]